MDSSTEEEMEIVVLDTIEVLLVVVEVTLSEVDVCSS